MVDAKFINVILLGLSFFLIFTAFQTGSIIQKTIVTKINDDLHLGWDAYNSACIVYFVFALANWIAPSTVAVLGTKYSMVIAAVTYVGFAYNFLFPVKFGLYLVSVCVGIGAAVIWTAQGNYLTMNSVPETQARNSGVFWALLQSSLLFGNLFVFFTVDTNNITEANRKTIFWVLSSTGVLGTLLLFTLRGGGRPSGQLSETMAEAKQAFKNSLSLMKTKTMILLCVTFFYTGIELSFFSGVYSAALGFTNELGNQKLIGLSGMLIGVGEILGGFTFGLLGNKTIKNGRDPIILLGYVSHIIAFFLIYINLPSRASLEATDAPAWIKSSAAIALLCSFLLGFGDSCYNTQLYSIIMAIYSADSAPAFALFKFWQSLAAAAAFFYSNNIGLSIHVYILSILATVGTMTFFMVEWATFAKEARERNSSNSSSPVSKHTECSSTN